MRLRHDARRDLADRDGRLLVGVGVTVTDAAEPERSDDPWAEIRRWYHTTAYAHITCARLIRRGERVAGFAQSAGVSVQIHEPIAFDGSDVELLGSRGTIDGRPMTGAERDALLRLLAQMAADARDALDGKSTLAVSIHRAAE